MLASSSAPGVDTGSFQSEDWPPRGKLPAPDTPTNMHQVGEPQDAGMIVGPSATLKCKAPSSNSKNFYVTAEN